MTKPATGREPLTETRAVLYIEEVRMALNEAQAALFRAHQLLAGADAPLVVLYEGISGLEAPDVEVQFRTVRSAG